MLRVGGRLTRLVLLVGALSCAFMLAGATARPVVDVVPWGVDLEADGLANLEIGKRPGRAVSFRFRALQSGRLAAVRIYLVHRDGGYMAGTGGKIRVDLAPDDGAGIPAKRVLASALIADPTSVDFPVVAFASRPRVRAGMRYHLVFTNPDPDPVANFVSLNVLYVESPDSSRARSVDPAVLWKSTGNRRWAVRDRRVPIFEVTYADRRRQGQRYIDARSSSGVVTIGGAGVACQLVVSARDRVVTSVNVRVLPLDTAAPLRMELFDQAGLATSAIFDLPQQPSSYRWLAAPLSFVLKGGVSYSVVMRSDAGSYAMFPYQKGTRYGFTDPFPGGRALLPDQSFDFPVYFDSRIAGSARAASPTLEEAPAGEVLDGC